MGCGGSRRRRGCGQMELNLPATQLRFNQNQLNCINNYFSDQLDNRECEIGYNSKADIESLIERLIQRLICAVGTLDSRFSSKFLITLNPTRSQSKSGLSLSYLIRLDSLSTPPLYPEQWEDQPVCVIIEGEGGPQGFAKIRLQGEGAQNWAEFINSNGFLRRDKIQERFVELLAQAASRPSLPGSPGHIDESRLCGSPGKVVDTIAVEQILNTPSKEQLYFGPADCNRSRFPDPREFRIAIVEGVPCVRLRIGFLTSNNNNNNSSSSNILFELPDEDVKVILVLGLGQTGWPQTCDFPSRIPLTHIDALLYQHAATTGFYLVPAAPHPTVRCDDRTATWQFRFPAAECILITYYSDKSVPNRLLSTLRSIIDDVHQTSNGGQVISDYMLKTLVWFVLEENSGSVIETLRLWDHVMLSSHVLKVLDMLVVSLRTQRHRSYFFPWFNIMLNSPGGGTQHYTEEDYSHDADLIEGFLRRLHSVSSSPSLLSVPADNDCYRKMESMLIDKWSDVLTDLIPPATTRSRRFSFIDTAGSSNTAGASNYSNRQLEYIGLLLRGMLCVKSLTLAQSQNMPMWCQNNTINGQPIMEFDSTSEDLIYLLTAILEQAKTIYRKNNKNNSRKLTSRIKYNRRNNNNNNNSSNRGTVASRLGILGHAGQVIDAYDASIYCLMEQVRNDKTNLDYMNDRVLVRQVLKWLYHALDRDSKYLGPILKPYLNQLFIISHENCWHIDELKKREMNDEAYALGKFCNLIVEEGLSPKDGITDALQKGWNWAETIVSCASKLDNGVELILTPADGSVIRHRITVLNRSKSNASLYSTYSLGRMYNKTTDINLINSSATLQRQKLALKESLTTRFNKSIKDPVNYYKDYVGTPHCWLRANNVLTVISENRRRYGNLRGGGSIIESLITLNKFTVLQEISSVLPEDERAQILDDIQRVSREKRRAQRSLPHTTNSNNNNNNNSCSLANSNSNSYRSNNSCNNNIKPQKQLDIQSYKLVDEFKSSLSLDVNLQSISDSDSAKINIDNDGVVNNLSNINFFGTLLGTCRAARSRQNLAAVCNPSFFDSPIFYQESVSVFNPSSQPFLKLTDDNQLTLALPEMISNISPNVRRKPNNNNNKKELVTKL
ncbi:uncharacterized protein LOC142333936 [Lycorma delicatula]|uniref:uncharacterized protein LOC142333936 n=1 Tax=Lycorma delicatula TaxID=130591 RepID=UPI003F515759